MLRGLHRFHGAHNSPIKYISGARPSVESKRRICAMERATSARRRSLVYIHNGSGSGTGRAEVFEQKRDGRTRQMFPQCVPAVPRLPFMGLHEKFRTHIPRCFVPLFSTTGLVIVGRPSLNRLRIQSCAHLHRFVHALLYAAGSQASV